MRVQEVLDHGGLITNETLYVSVTLYVGLEVKGKVQNCTIISTANPIVKYIDWAPQTFSYCLLENA